METYGKILLIAMPAFLLLVLGETLYGAWKGKQTVRNLDMISSLSSGITNVTKDVLGLSIAIISYGWLVDKLALVHVQNSILTYIIAFIALDFAGYWVHRLDHEYNFFWNAHIIHHSSEDFNLACALRQSISVVFRIFTIFLLPAALLGVPPMVIAVVAPLHLFAQFWYHTQHINRMGFLEKIIVTPSHHRVHHAINPEYLDKNYGQIFIFWDKWFGTYQEELADKPPVYGITRPVQTWNPIKINFMHLWLMIKDAWHTKNWNDKFRIWIMPTGWRPADVAEKFPVHKINDVYHMQKYDTKASPSLHVWSWVQITMALLFISYLFGNIAPINTLNASYIYVYGLFVFLSVYAYTELMDRNKYAIVWEIIKNSLGIAIILQTGDWFGATALSPFIKYGVGAYFLLSTIVTLWFVMKHAKEDERVMAVA
ncbi:sterol desaturase/sphingolipid hydroxylase (fatty acid hydroxylase superfamily) [Lacibacter cauensis]|uniref:Sterol desaturase/sphingolipid hydroxylase (Fatty acid hydroxylase superfamily) n=1 Tax=Lacibacter cauensis TaxID=510947 RepID=A0A562SRG1_9BACT|nr:sterol desaturase family protein [Lacibacter cauensis]TWI83831.1 sterol desaturase/sphingolipid hydroxylase (fatty acid hydroxylase superfamily) [Lacibacter cauensis]